MGRPKGSGHGTRARTCDEVAEADGGEADKGEVDGLVKGPVLEVHEDEGRAEHEDEEAEAGIDENASGQAHAVVAVRPVLVSRSHELEAGGKERSGS